ncbi:sugar phosphate isomerase/epimerase [Kocuria sp. SM24M-10]|uniref:sugar phosphate isomerase/epimerase family protein n=1 Tax=Kocuria sp. SM24M-10 TaxID=1660349 RepID=UPI0009E2F648|nr:sugar phosphate isomerase/epimerase [Kocuria sp. SM24M-10]
MSEQQGSAAEPYRAHVALSTSSLYPLGVPETFEAAVELGYDSVEVLVTHERMSQLNHQLRDLVQRHQLPISTIHAPTLLLTQQVWGKSWTKIQMAAALTEQVGAEVVVVHPPFRWQRKYASNFVEGVRVVSEATGVKISVENMYPWRVRGRDTVVYAPHYSPLGQDYDWVTWDFSHAATARMDSLAAIRELGPRLGHVHLTDGSGETTADEHLLPGHGVQPVAESLQHLAATRWQGVIGVEVSTRRSTSTEERTQWLAESLDFARRHTTPAEDAPAEDPPAEDPPADGAPADEAPGG